MIDFFAASWAGRIIRLFGVLTLYCLGFIRKVFYPGIALYSLKSLYQMDYCKKDDHRRLMEGAGQQMAGVLFMLFATSVYLLVRHFI